MFPFELFDFLPKQKQLPYASEEQTKELLLLDVNMQDVNI